MRKRALLSALAAIWVFVPIFGIQQEREPLAEPLDSGVETGAQSRWYRSNALGMALSPLAPPNLTSGGGPWILHIETNPQQRRKTLYFRGRMRDVWERNYQNGLSVQEQHRRLGKLLENRFFDEDSGLLSELSRYSEENGALEQQSLFFYDEEGRLERSLTYEGGGVLLRESRYLIGEQGELVKLRVQFHTKERSLVQYELPGIHSMAREATGDSSRYLVSLFNRQRQNVAQIVYEGGRVARRTDFEYSAAGGLVGARIAEPGKVTEYRYNSSEQPLQKQVSGKVQENYFYDNLGRLIRKELLRANLEERYSYSGADVEKIEFYRDGEIDKIRTYQNLNSYTEELYLNGAAVAKVYYSYGDELKTTLAPSPEEFSQTDRTDK